jgi:hypothetical protein
VLGHLNILQFEAQVTNGRMEYKKGGHSSDPCILTTHDALCKPYFHASRSTLNKVQYPAERYVLQVTWLHEMMTHCLTLNVAKASQPQRTCEVVSDACLHLSHSGFFTSLSLNKCVFQLQCPLSNLVIILSWFLLRLSTSPAFSQMVF